MKHLLTGFVKRVGVGAVTVGALALSGTAAAVAVGLTSSVEDVTPAPDEPAFTTAPTITAPLTIEEPAPVTPEAMPAPEPPAEQVVSPPAATVNRVTEPTNPPAAQPQVADPESIGTFDANGVYQPAPPSSRPGEPPVAPQPVPPPVDSDPTLPPIKNG